MVAPSVARKQLAAIVGYRSQFTSTISGFSRDTIPMFLIRAHFIISLCRVPRSAWLPNHDYRRTGLRGRRYRYVLGIVG
jgi:hypothetical protein